MLSPTASNAPARKDTHPDARNVPDRSGAGPGGGGVDREGPCCAHLARAVNDE